MAGGRSLDLLQALTRLPFVSPPQTSDVKGGRRVNTKSIPKPVDAAKKAVYVAVGAGRSAFEGARSVPRSIPKRAAGLSSLVKERSAVVRSLPTTALPKVAGKFALQTAVRVKDLAVHVAKDASKRFDSYAAKGQSLLNANGRANGSGNGSSRAVTVRATVAKPKTAAKKPRAPKAVTPTAVTVEPSTQTAHVVEDPATQQPTL